MKVSYITEQLGGKKNEAIKNKAEILENTLLKVFCSGEDTLKNAQRWISSYSVDLWQGGLKYKQYEL